MIFIHVTNENVDKFNKLAKTHDSFLKYYMPGCGHCVAMESDWETMKKQIPRELSKNRDVLVGEINSEAVPKLSGYNDILGYPTIVYLKNGNLKDEYSGERTSNKMLEWVLLHLKNQSGGNKRRKPKSKTKKTHKKRRSTKLRKYKSHKKNRK
jgi:thioredoxin-like negative regulator of GroEL